MEKGIIVSIQTYTQPTTQELVNRAVMGGAVGIRTDKKIETTVPVIGLSKDFDKEYYITNSTEELLEIGKWADYVAVDCRKGNENIKLLLSIAHVSNIKIVADVETIEDVQNVLRICNTGNIAMPSFFATTFSKCDQSLVFEITKLGLPCIAEGGYNKRVTIRNAMSNNAHAVCVGEAISDIEILTRKYKEYI